MDLGVKLVHDGSVNDYKKSIYRSKIFVAGTSGVEDYFFTSAVEGLNHLINEFDLNLEVVNYESYNLGSEPFESTDWYQRLGLLRNHESATKFELANLDLFKVKGSSYTYKPFFNKLFQDYSREGYTGVSFNGINHLLINEPFQKTNPHFDLFIIDENLCDLSLGFKRTYGISEYPVTVLSTHLLKTNDLSSIDLGKGFELLCAHEFGHFLGLVNRARKISRIDGDHCLEGVNCVMRQVGTGQLSLVEQIDNLYPRKEWFCDHCHDEVEERMKYLNQQGIKLLNTKRY